MQLSHNSLSKAHRIHDMSHVKFRSFGIQHRQRITLENDLNIVVD